MNKKRRYIQRKRSGLKETGGHTKKEKRTERDKDKVM